jgi:hypoxanthine phosphoribosyltransferase
MKKVYYNWQQVQGAVLEIARQLSAHDWKPDYIVGLTRGGLVPAILLSQYTGIKMHTLNVSLRDNNDDCESNLWMAEDAIGVVPLERSAEFGGHKHVEKLKKKILIVDDINDTGATINWIKKDWPSGCYPDDTEWNQVWGDNVRFAVLTHNFTSEFKDPDYYVWTVNKAEDDCWLVYPWEDFWL